VLYVFDIWNSITLMCGNWDIVFNLPTSTVRLYYEGHVDVYIIKQCRYMVYLFTFLCMIFKSTFH